MFPLPFLFGGLLFAPHPHAEPPRPTPARRSPGRGGGGCVTFFAALVRRFGGGRRGLRRPRRNAIAGVRGGRRGGGRGRGDVKLARFQHRATDADDAEINTAAAAAAAGCGAAEPAAPADPRRRDVEGAPGRRGRTTPPTETENGPTFWRAAPWPKNIFAFAATTSPNFLLALGLRGAP